MKSTNNKKYLLIFDLNGTLIHRTTKLPQNFLKNNYFTVKKRKIFTRPHLNSLFSSIPPIFKIAIWTSAQKHTIQPILDKIFPKIEFEFVWFREKCILKKEDFKFCIKDLEKVWENQGNRGEGNNSSSSKEDRSSCSLNSWNERNTVLIDDSLDKCVNQPLNCLNLKEFTLEGETYDDDCLLGLQEWLHSVDEKASNREDLPDVRDFIKEYKQKHSN